MAMLIAAAAAFLAIHLLVSGTRLRDAITGAIGEGPYLGLFSLASLALIVWLCVAYPGAADENVQLFDLGPGVKHLGIPVVAVAFFFAVQGILSKNPTSVRQEASASQEGTVQGVLRITRHAFLWGVALWAAFHLAANGDLASLILFGTFLILGVFGGASIDSKRRRKMGADWEAFAAKTSNLPFAAILAGRTKLNLAEAFGWRFLVAAVVFAAILFAHPFLFGVSPFPGGWRPF